MGRSENSVFWVAFNVNRLLLQMFCKISIPYSAELELYGVSSSAEFFLTLGKGQEESGCSNSTIHKELQTHLTSL